MEKKFKAATERVAEGNLRNKRQYLPPVMEFTSFTLENGFAGSPLYPKGSNPATMDFGGEEMEEETWNVGTF